MTVEASKTIGHLMEQASQALAGMDYLTCERQCVEALGLARAAGDWADYCRILLPLQEARRQRRMIASQGTIRLGTGELSHPPATWISHLDAGCIVVTKPHGVDVAGELSGIARRDHKWIEVLFVDGVTTDPVWTLRSFNGPLVVIQRTAPDRAWVDRWLAPQERLPGGEPSGKGEQRDERNGEIVAGPSDWFLNAAESLGDAALEQVTPELLGADRIAALEQRLLVVADHEIMHQALWQAARQMCALS